MDAKTHELNAKLVANVKKHRVLYDNTVPEYAIKRYSKSAWEAIAKVCGLSENECKLRWRNLRISFLRYNRTKRNSNSHVKPYYLQEDMAFMLPFIRTPTGVNRRKSAVHSPRQRTVSRRFKFKPEAHDELKEITEGDDDSQDIQFEYLDETDEKHVILETTSKRGSPLSIIGRDSEEQQDVVQSLQSTKDNIYEIVTTSRRDMEDNPDWNFLKSFLPDLQKMSPGQKIKFKLALCSAINDILYV
ncbi:uncharacterized protein LOC132256929 [Phlebotomus argentipes]|uniref:uncharacterized protein LOC132256929 n=1 Tax=Phlebotomus argentipes TaxID=94469 RepID=UPI002892EA76|nr:uncharacterized protein LOC132256929 [Phlebotomus argentipes]